MTGRLVVAAFDFDGTLTRGGSVGPFLAAMVGPTRALRAAVALTPRLTLGAVVGDGAADDAKEALFVQTLGGLRAADVTQRAAQFGRDHYRRHARHDTRQRLEWHRRHGHRLVIVSASPRCYVSAVGEELGVDSVVATDLEISEDGLLTGHYRGRNCRGSEKLDRVRDAMASWVTPDVDTTQPPQLWAYGNSMGDRCLLDGADVGVNVGRLGRLGRLRHFPRLAAVR